MKERTPVGGGYFDKRRGQYFARVTDRPRHRVGVSLPWCTALADAKARGLALQPLVNVLREANQETWIEKVLEVGATPDAGELSDLQDHVASIVKGKIVKAEPTKELSAGSTESVLAAFRAEAASNGCAEATLTGYDKKIAVMLPLLPARAQEIDRACIMAFRDRRLETARRTVVLKDFKILKPALRLAKISGHYHRDVEEVFPKLKDDYRPGERWAEPLELLGIACVLSPAKVARVAFAVAVGCDPGAVDRARREDVRADFKGARVRGTKNENRDRFAACPLPEQQTLLRWAVEHSDGKDGLLFASWKTCNKDLGVACEKLGISHLTPTDLRRTYATWLRHAGIPTDLIGLCMGHVGRTMVERIYGRMDRDEDVIRVTFAAAKVAALAAAESDDSEVDGGKVANSKQIVRRRLTAGQRPLDAHGSTTLTESRDVAPGLGGAGRSSEFAQPRDAAASRPPRERLIADLSDAVRDAALVGDVRALKVATDALAALVGTGVTVGDLADRARRG